jgi:HTH-type transcriptional regulator / antitoxin HigA
MNYTIIKTDKQYKEYCNKVRELGLKKSTKAIENEVELLDLLIEAYSKNRFKFRKQDPIELLKNLMENQNMNQNKLEIILGVSKSYVSQILNYKKGLSKDVIRKLAKTFKVNQEAFNREYQLVSKSNVGHTDEKMMNIKKKFEKV